MKILIPGWNAEQSFETACMREFKKLGHHTLIFENKPVFPWNLGRDWWNLTPPERFLNDTITSWRLYRTVARERPDWVFMTKGENLRAETFTMMKRKLPTKLALWYVDNPFHANVSSFQALRHIQKSDIYFIWAKYLLDPLLSAGADRVDFLPFAFDPAAFPEIEIPSEERERWRSDVCFVGTWDKERETALLPLANQGFDLAIYGQGWARFLSANSRLRAHVRTDSIWMQDVVKAFKGAKIVLNLLRKHNWKGHNFRTMEAAGIGGGALLTPWTSDQANELFQENEEILCFKGLNPDPALIKSLLAKPSMLATLSMRAKARVYREHLLGHRITSILSHLGAKGSYLKLGDEYLSTVH